MKIKAFCEKLIKNKSLFYCLLLLILVGVAGTFAYYYSENVIPNRFRTMTYNVSLEEEFNDNWGVKKVSFVNHESVDVVLRINYNETWSNTEGFVLSNIVNGENVVTKAWTTAFIDDFVKKDDGWYYYKKVLKANETVKVLDSIAKNTTVINASPDKALYDTYQYDLSFNYEAIQATSNAIQTNWGKNVTINGSDVTWP